MTTSKRKAAIQKFLADQKLPSVVNARKAIEVLCSIPPSKFVESFDVSVNLGIVAEKSEQTVRGACNLPHGTGKVVRVAVFTQGNNAKLAEEAGADAVGMDDLAERAKANDFPYDVVIASPDAMRVVGQLGQVLGPKGLMPNPKVGTVTPDVATAVRNAKAGQVRFRNDKAGIIHARIGNVSLSADKLLDNLKALLVDLRRLKPSTSKGVYLKRVTLSTTMGPGLKVDISSIDE
jgi:large subunit ribosomal protein L1